MASPLSGVALRHLVHELELRLSGSWLDNLYQLDPDTFLFRFRSKKHGRQQLLVPLTGIPHLSEETLSTPSTPTLAATLLRKRLRKSRLLTVTQPGLNRILRLGFASEAEQLELVIELLRPANLLVIENGVILWVLKPRDYRHRSLRTGKPYSLPPGNFDPTGLSEDAILERLQRSSGSLSKAISREFDLGPLVAKELVNQLEIKEDGVLIELEADLQLDLAAMITELLDVKLTRAHLYLQGEEPTAVYPWPSTLHPDAQVEQLENLSSGYSRLHQFGMERLDAEQPQPELERQDRRVQQQAAAAKRYIEKSQDLRDSADALYANYELAQKMLNTLEEMIEEGGWEVLSSRMEQLPGLLEIEPSKQRVKVRLADLEVTLYLNTTVDQNANRLYDEAKRLAHKAAGAKEAEAQTRAQPVEIPERSNDKHESPSLWFERYRWFIASSGNIVVAGKDAHSNEVVVRRYLKDNDVFCHADLTGAPAVVVKHQELEVGENAAQEGCLYSLAYSKAWGARVASGHTYWTTADQVSKSPVSGEFVAKGAFIIRGQRHWHRNQPVEAGIGWTKVEGADKLMGGPVPAVEARCEKFIILRPGFLERKVVAQVLAKALEAPIDTLERVLPPGPCDLLRSHGVEVLWPSNE